MQNTNERSIRIKLKPADSFLKHFSIENIEETPSISIPTSLSKPGLTSVVLHFLKEASLDHIEITLLEFYDPQRESLVKGILEKHLKKFSITEEEVLTLEYSLPKSSKFIAEGPGAPVPDWISCISSIDKQVFAGSFDGSIIVSELKNDAGLTVKSIEDSAHTAQITGCKSFKFENSIYLATSSKDACVSVRKLLANGKIGERIATCVSGQGNSLETVCVANSSDDKTCLIASSGWGGDIYFFQAPLESGQVEEEEDEEENKIKKKKDQGKRTKASPKGSIIHPACTLRGHTDNVSSCVWSSNIDPVTLFSGSWDHSLRIWDCVRQVETAALHAQKPFTTIDYLPSQQLVASGHPDHIVRLWDARASGDSIVKLSMKGHHGWISSVAFEGGSSTFLASASYDRTVRIWDIRGGIPLQIIQTDVSGKLFAVNWGEKGQLFLGGTDSVLRTYTTSS